VPDDGSLPHLLEWADATAPAPVERTPIPGLTPCEIRVLDDAAHGLTVDETADRLHKGAETVKTQRRSILMKLGARNMAQAVWMTTIEDVLEHVGADRH
jgi:DNA-binding NarL/FixJ family response regulator